jgi:DNA-directed RNA polymerase subunit M/transcription elongation factor TFIIS
MQRDEYIHNAKPAAMTNQFKCGRCKKNECSHHELQLRSCDEPATQFITCINCAFLQTTLFSRIRRCR